MKPVAIIVLCCFISVVASAQCPANILLADSCLKTGASFQIQTSFPIASVTWDFGDPSAGNTDNMSVIAHHKYSYPGKYTVTMNAVLGCGHITTTRTINITDCTDTCNATLVVVDSCLNHTLPFTVRSRYAINGVTWHFNDRFSNANTSGDMEGKHVFTKEGVYTITAMADLACRKDTIVRTVTIVDCDTIADEGCQLFIPTAFTPNGDSKNEDFKPLTYCKLAGYQLWIFNRWGQLVYTTKNAAAGWDGMQKGFKSPAGNYMYIVNYRFAGRNPKTAKGSVLLLR